MVAYLIVVGATPVGELYVGFRVLNAVIASAVLLVYMVRAPAAADGIDKVALVALLGFAVVSVLSAFPRQSFDAYLSMAAYVAAFFVARDLVRDSRVKRLLLGMMRVLAAIVVVLAVLQQAQPLSEWMRIAGWEPPPPTGMPFSGLQWGNRYDLVLLAVMLFPAWLAGQPRRWRLVTAAGLAVMLALVVLNAGSRNIWVAAAGASVIVIGRRLLRRPGSIPTAVWIGLVAVAVITVVAVLAVEPLRERLLTPQTIGQRYAMWSALLDAWSDRPLTGYGPGSFPWLLQLTDYFDSNAIAPRHPDSAVFQLVAEGGVVGVASGAILMVGVAAALARRGTTIVVWPLAFFALAGLNSNPTDFGFLVVPAIIWAAIGLPREPNERRPEPTPRHRVAQPALIAGTAIVLCAYVLTLVAGLRYESGFLAGRRGDFAAARASLSEAAALDPSMALYWRQTGTAALLQGDLEAAGDALARAVEINGLDDLAWRTLALVHASGGRNDLAQGAANRAVKLQRSDPTNLLLAFAISSHRGIPASRDEIAEVLLAWPELTAAPGWRELLPNGISTADALELGVARWQAGGSAPAPVVGQPLLLVAISGHSSLVEEASQLADMPSELVDAWAAMSACEPDVSDILAAAPTASRHDPTFWEMAARLNGVGAFDANASRRILAALSGRKLLPEYGSLMLNPLHENNAGGYSADAWGYRRLPIPWPDPSIVLPNRIAGEANLLYRWDDLTCP